MDIEEVLADSRTAAVLERWWVVRFHEAPAYSGGVLDAWPALLVDGLAACRHEEEAIGTWMRWSDGPDAQPPR